MCDYTNSTKKSKYKGANMLAYLDSNKSLADQCSSARVFLRKDSATTTTTTSKSTPKKRHQDTRQRSDGYLMTTNELNYNYMINYENSCPSNLKMMMSSSCSSSSSSGRDGGSSSSGPSIVTDDLEIFNRLNREDLMVDHFRWLSEKPLSVLQLDPADRAVLKIADQRDKIQKKTFTKWVNKHLSSQKSKVTDLFVDLRDGINLILLLEQLSSQRLVNYKKDMAILRFHALQNVNICLNFLVQNNIKIVNIRPDEIVDGNPKLTLGLIWIIILHFQISDITFQTHGREVKAKEGLMLWVNKNLLQDGSSPKPIKDFSHSWRDGKAFLSILNRHLPAEKMKPLMQQQADTGAAACGGTAFRTNKQTLQLAFDLAESEFGVTPLLDAEDVDVQAPCEKSIITYVSSLFDALPKNQQTNTIEKAHSTPNIDYAPRKQGVLQDYSILYTALHRWLTQSINSQLFGVDCTLSAASSCSSSSGAATVLPADFVELKSLCADLKSFQLEEYRGKRADLNKIASMYSELQNYYPKQLMLMMDPQEDLSVLQSIWYKLEGQMQIRESQLDKALESWDQNQRKYEAILKSTKTISQNLNTIRDQTNNFFQRIESTPPVKPKRYQPNCDNNTTTTMTTTTTTTSTTMTPLTPHIIINPQETT
jgi:hypothetical protein